MAKKKPAAKKKKAPARKGRGKCRKSTTGKGTKPGEGSTGPKHIDWAKAKRLYVTCGRYLSHEALIEHLVDEFGNKVECNVSVIHRRARKEKWVQQRKEYIAGVTADFIKVIGERYVLSRVASLDQLEAVRDKLVDSILEGKVEKVTVADLLNTIKQEVALYEGRDPDLMVPVQVGRSRGDKGGGIEHVKKALLSALKSGKLTREQMRKAVTK